MEVMVHQVHWDAEYSWDSQLNNGGGNPTLNLATRQRILGWIRSTLTDDGKKGEEGMKYHGYLWASPADKTMDFYERF